MDRSARNDAIAGVLVLLVVGIFASATGDIYVDPLDPGFGAQDFPIAVLTLIAIFAVGLLVRAGVALARSGWQFYEAGEAADILRYVVPMVAVASGYVLLLYMFQYPLPTFFATIGALAIYGNRGFGRLLLAPFLATAVYYVMFYGVLGLFEEPGTVWSYSNQSYFRPLRDALGLF